MARPRPFNESSAFIWKSAIWPNTSARIHEMKLTNGMKLHTPMTRAVIAKPLTRDFAGGKGAPEERGSGEPLAKGGAGSACWVCEAELDGGSPPCFVG